MNDSKDTVNRLYGQKVRVRACGLLLGPEGLLLAKHEGIGKAGTLWIPPGGGVQFGELLPEALVREFREETGLEVQVLELVRVHEFIDPPLHAIEFYFEVAAVGGALKTGTDPEMPAHNQILKEVTYLSREQLKAISEEELHPVLHSFRNQTGPISRQPVYHLPKPMP